MKIDEILFQYRFTDKVAVIYKHNLYTYKYLCERVDKLQNNLQCISNRKYNAGICIKNSIEFILAYFISMHMGWTVIPINIDESIHKIEEIILQCDIDLLFVSDYTSKNYVEKLNTKVNIININWESKHMMKTIRKFSFKERKYVKEQATLILHTSGSTGGGKNVMLSDAAIIENIKGNIKALNILENDISLVILPLTYCYCNIAQVLSSFYIGSTIVIYDSILYKKYIFETIDRYRCTSIFSVPSIYENIFFRNIKEVNQLSSLKLITVGGARLNKDIVKKSCEVLTKIRLAITYGMTEAGPRISTLFPQDDIEGIGSVGKPIEGYSIKIINKDKDGIGEVVVSGKSLMLGYYKNEYETQKILKEKKLSTGDMGYIDEEGNLFLVGRYKNIIISGGQNIVVEEVESILEECDYVIEALVCSEYDNLLQEVPVAQIVINNKLNCKKELIVHNIREHCKDKLARYKIPRRFYIVDEIKKNHNGKKNRRNYIYGE